MMLKLLLLVFLMISSFITGCQQQDAKPQIETAKKMNELSLPIPMEDKNNKKGSITRSYTGTVQYFNLEGGFYGIVTDNGEKLLPMNIDKKYLKAGTVIAFSGHYEENRMSIQQWGKTFKIEKIELIKAGKKNINPNH